MADENYSLQETLQKLALTEEQLSNLVRDGKLREFRIDGGQKFKVSEVDDLAMELNPPLTETSDGGSESAIELLPVDASDSGLDVISLEESGSQIGAEPEAPAATPPKKRGDTVITPAGVSVFDEDELAGLDADPMAKTQIAPSLGEELAVEGSGSSGSGLLDLSRESDDTSLGGVLDEIYSTGEETMPEAVAGPTGDGLGEGIEQIEEPTAETAPAAASRQRVVVGAEGVDATSGPFVGLIVAALILLGFSGFVAASLTADVLPSFLQTLSGNILFPIIGIVFIPLIAAGVGFVMSKR